MMACKIMGHEHRVCAAVIQRKVEEDGASCFSYTYVESCYRCGDTKRSDLSLPMETDEALDLFTMEPEMLGPVEGRKWSVSLDGRPMGYITQINNTTDYGWSATRPNGCVVDQKLSKQGAAAALW